MNTHTLLSAGSLATAGLFLGHLSHLEAGEVGPMAAYMPPAPVSDCDACNDPGWYGGVSLLYMKPYGGDGGEGADGEWDIGARGTIGFERPDGLFYELNGFWFEGEYDVPSSGNTSFDSEVSAWYIEGLVGDNLHCGEACLDFAFGIRYANLERDFTRIERNDGIWRSSFGDDFEGIGPVVRIDGTRRLTDRVSLYAGVSQAILFGERDFSASSSDSSPAGNTPPPGFAVKVGDNSRDTLAFVTELEGGLLFDLSMNARVRLGIEGQYWSLDSSDFGFFGGVLGVDFNF